MRSSLFGLVAVFVLVASFAALTSAHFSPHALSRVHMENVKVAAPSAAASITIDAPVLNGTGSMVTVTFSNMPSVYPGNFDWIGVWSPKPAAYNETTPAKYKYVIPDGTGSGSTKLWLVNARASYVVAYFTGGLDTPTLLAESPAVEFSNYHIPLQIHLALTADPTQMRVNWNSAQNMFPSVNYGLSATSLNNSILRVLTTTYKRTDLCGEPGTTKGWNEPGYLHSALLTDLTPNTQYFYQVGDESSYSKSEIMSFYSAPPASASFEPDFVIFGDLGQVEIDGSNEASQMDGSILTTDSLAKDLESGVVALDRSAAVFHIGDISYARGYETLWEQFFYQISSMSGVVPWMTVDGNHERDYPNSGSLYTGKDSGGECGVPYEHRFSMPTSGTDQTWYSLNYGPIHWLIISTEHAFAEGSPQFAFISADLAAVDRSKTPFLLVAGHRPMYIDSTNDSPDGGDRSVAKQLRDALEPLMKQYKVDAAFWGHHHSYQRTCAVYNSTCAEDGIVHIVTGAAGAGFSTNLRPDTPDWIEFVECDTHGYIHARLRGQKLKLDFVSSNDRSILDSITLDSKFPFNATKEKEVTNTNSLWLE